MSSKLESKNSKLNVALVHDFLLYYGGAERTLKELSDIYPEAPIYTLMKDEKNRDLFGDYNKGTALKTPESLESPLKRGQSKHRSFKDFLNFYESVIGG